MALKETIKKMSLLLEEIINDLKKSERGFKSASQRVRTGSVELEKIGKIYRKESVAEEKKIKRQKDLLKAKKAKNKKR